MLSEGGIFADEMFEQRWKKRNVNRFTTVERVFPRCGTRRSSVRHRLPVKLQLYAFQFFRGEGGGGGEDKF